MTSDKIKAIREALEKATPGPWERRRSTHGGQEVHEQYRTTGGGGFPGRIIAVCSRAHDTGFAAKDAHFITLARNELPGLLDELEAKTQTILRMGRMLAREGLVCTDGPDPVERELESLRAENKQLRGAVNTTSRNYAKLDGEAHQLRAEIKAAQRRIHDAGYKSAAAMLNGVVRGDSDPSG